MTDFDSAASAIMFIERLVNATYELGLLYRLMSVDEQTRAQDYLSHLIILYQRRDLGSREWTIMAGSLFDAIEHWSERIRGRLAVRLFDE